MGQESVRASEAGWGHQSSDERLGRQAESTYEIVVVVVGVAVVVVSNLREMSTTTTPRCQGERKHAESTWERLEVGGPDGISIRSEYVRNQDENRGYPGPRDEPLVSVVRFNSSIFTLPGRITGKESKSACDAAGRT